ncbi:MAG: hypothetical protein Q8R92_16005, partial [Deltaproteobacteria bacterium]|nr:hypothetical protein [Deltaproteobacteria bacterium]
MPHAGRALTLVASWLARGKGKCRCIFRERAAARLRGPAVEVGGDDADGGQRSRGGRRHTR